MAVHIGTSGWSYGHWEGVLYPEGLPPRRRLDYYLPHFRTAELNSSYYRWPDRAAFDRWRRRLPEDFLLSVKAPGLLTHVKRLYAPERWLTRISQSVARLGTRRGVLLVQLPPGADVDHARLQYFLAQIPTGLQVAFEFRHPGWHQESVFQLLERYGAGYCVMSGAGLPCILRATARFVYVRLHGPDRHHLYGGSVLGRRSPVVGRPRARVGPHAARRLRLLQQRRRWARGPERGDVEAPADGVAGLRASPASRAGATCYDPGAPAFTVMSSSSRRNRPGMPGRITTRSGRNRFYREVRVGLRGAAGRRGERASRRGQPPDRPERSVDSRIAAAVSCGVRDLRETPAADLSRLVRSVKRFGRQSAADVIRDYRLSGHDLRGVGVVVGSLIDPETIANDHIRIHALEGRLFRSVVEEAAVRCRLACSLFRERDLYAAASATFHKSELDLARARDGARPRCAGFVACRAEGRRTGRVARAGRAG